jgi:hypothetical protein
MSVLSKGTATGATTPNEHGGREAPAPAATGGPDPVISEADKRFFETFGFLRIKGLFAPDIDTIIEGFEEVFEAEHGRTFDTNMALHFNEKRSIVPAFATRSDKLTYLLDDPRTTSVVSTLMGKPFEYSESDGNLFYCDTSWHPDSYGAPMSQVHLKLSLYLDPLHGENGAIRMIPGTNFWESEYATTVRGGVYDPDAIEATYGVKPEELPSWTLESEPGDLIVWSFRTVHASFNGGQRRRLFSINFREALAPDDEAGRAERENAAQMARAAMPEFYED